MSFVNPTSVFRGVVCVAVPHMDDGVLACGGSVALLPRGSQVHFVYATDGSRSPAPLFPWIGSVPRDRRGTFTSSISQMADCVSIRPSYASPCQPCSTSCRRIDCSSPSATISTPTTSP